MANSANAAPQVFLFKLQTFPTTCATEAPTVSIIESHGDAVLLATKD